jgi:hypothetical protein
MFRELVLSIDDSECGQDLPRFGRPSIRPEIAGIQYDRVLNIINLNYTMFYNVL